MSKKRQFHKRPENDPCIVEDCDSQKRNAKYCSKHAARVQRYGDPDIVKPHYKSSKTCSVIENDEKCEAKHIAKGMCRKHYRRWYEHGDPLFKIQTGNSPARYKLVTSMGHPNARPNGRILEHRLVMSEMIGRALYEHENVHHINGDKLDNRPENLELWSHSQPRGQRVEDKVEWAVELLELYAPDKLKEINDRYRYENYYRLRFG